MPLLIEGEFGGKWQNLKQRRVQNETKSNRLNGPQSPWDLRTTLFWKWRREGRNNQDRKLHRYAMWTSLPSPEEKENTRILYCPARRGSTTLFLGEFGLVEGTFWRQTDLEKSRLQLASLQPRPESCKFLFVGLFKRSCLLRSGPIHITWNGIGIENENAEHRLISISQKIFNHPIL